MGKVVTKAWLRNNQDVTRLADGRIAVEQVRQQEQELIVDTGREQWAYRYQLSNSWACHPHAR